MIRFKNQFKLGKRKIKNYEQPYVIAEIGSNYDQNLKKAFQYIELSKKLGADCVKFQLFEASNFFENKDKNYDVALFYIQYLNTSKTSIDSSPYLTSLL